MKISTKLEQSDYKEFVLFVQKNLSVRKYTSFLPNFFVWMVIAFCITVALNLKSIRTNAHAPTVLFMLLLFLVIIMAYTLPFRTKMKPTEDGFILGSRTYIIEREEFKDVRDTFESKTKWESILYVGETGNHLFLMLDTMTGHIIPKRDLTDETIAIIKEHVESGQANKEAQVDSQGTRVLKNRGK